ncbi:hypothetical protein IT396_01475 [Candidatus Nomurabacteria bacterium]|nr:hypothetical protein [Candidatus Nomurabacteria bacterium]
MEFFPKHKGRFIGASVAAVYLLLIGAAFIGNDSLAQFANVSPGSQTALSICDIPGVGCGDGIIYTNDLKVTIVSWALPPYGGSGELYVKTHGYTSYTGVNALCVYKNLTTGVGRTAKSGAKGEARIKDFGPINGTTQVKITCTNYYATYSSSDSTKITLKNAPDITFQADPTELTYSGAPVTSNITWKVGNDYKCRLTGPGVSISKTEAECQNSTVTAVPFSSPGSYTYDLEYVPYSDKDGNDVWATIQSVTVDVLPPADLCPSLAGTQTSYPSGSSPANSCTCPSGYTYDSGSNACVALDLCPSLAGTQTSYPSGSSPTNSCTCPSTSTYNSSTNSCAAATDLCPSLGGTQTSYPSGSSPANSCTCPATYTYNSGTNRCTAPVAADLCPSLAGTQTSYPSGSNPPNSCTCPGDYISATNRCMAPVTGTPTLNITGNGQQNTVTVTPGTPVTVVGTFVAASGDSLVATALNDNASNPLPGVPNSTATSPKTYVFTPTAVGSYVFYPAARTSAYPSWNNYGKALVVNVIPASVFTCTGAVPSNATLCTADDTGLTSNTARTLTSSCSIPRGSAPKCQYTCQSGYTIQGSTCEPNATCSGAHQLGTPPNCTCEVGYIMQYGSCVAVACPGAHEVNYPACTCGSGYTRDAGSGQCVMQPALELQVNGADAARVRAGSGVEIIWNATGVQAGSCTVRTSAGTTISSGVNSGSSEYTVAGQTIFRLSCLNDAGGVVTDEAVVNIIPTFIES